MKGEFIAKIIFALISDIIGRPTAPTAPIGTIMEQNLERKDWLIGNDADA